MTDEEKAEKYSDNLDLVKERNPELKTNNDFIKQAYFDGLAEGRKESIKWHKVTCFDEPNEDGYITLDAPADIGEEFLIKTKTGYYVIQELSECEYGVIFEDYEWEEIEAWAEIPKLK